MTDSIIIKACPCGGLRGGVNTSGGKKRTPTYAQCCEPFHLGLPAPTAETLMRSRYSAFALGVKSCLHDYLQATWHPRTRPAQSAANEGVALEWLGLTITHQVTVDATHAKVRFIARYRTLGRVHRLVETSQFVREVAPDGMLRWFYVDGEVK